MLNTEESANNPQNPPATASTTAQTASAPESVAGARVSAEEFSAAIQALEQRKAEEARRYANTVDVGKTIQELNIDATPEDVMREVQAQRAARSGPRLAGVPPHSQMTDAQAANREQLRSASVMLKDYYDKNLAPSRVQVGVPEVRSSWRDRRFRRGPRSKWGVAIGVTAFIVFLATNIGHNGFHSIAFDGDDGDSASHASPIKLSQLTDDSEGYTDTAGLLKIIADGGLVNATDQNIVLAGEKTNSSWTISKHDGKLYLKGYTQPKKTSDLSLNPFDVYSQGNGGDLHGEDDDDITIPLTGTQVSSSFAGDGWSELQVQHIQPDSHTNVDD